MVWYNYRRVPAVTLAKQLIDEGRLGRIFHYRAKFLQDWTISKDLPQGGAGLWRLDVNVAGSGVTGDLLAHCIDTALWLNGGIDSVTGMTETFIKERKHTLTGKVEKVGIDDASAFLARFRNPLVTRAATRRFIPLRSMAKTPASPGTSTTCTACNTSITPTKAACAAGAMFMLRTAIILT
jgi:predicted dehydrogenase